MFDPRDDTRGRCEDGRERATMAVTTPATRGTSSCATSTCRWTASGSTSSTGSCRLSSFVVRTGGATGDGWALKNDASPRGRAP